MKWTKKDTVVLVSIIFLGIIASIGINSCMLMNGKLVDANEWTEPASVCEYKVLPVYRTQFRAGKEGEKDFYWSVKSQLDWLWTHDCEVFKLSYEYGFDMLHTKILRCVFIYYTEVKNE